MTLCQVVKKALIFKPQLGKKAGMREGATLVPISKIVLRMRPFVPVPATLDDKKKGYIQGTNGNTKNDYHVKDHHDGNPL